MVISFVISKLFFSIVVPEFVYEFDLSQCITHTNKEKNENENHFLAHSTIKTILIVKALLTLFKKKQKRNTLLRKIYLTIITICLFVYA